MDWILTGFKHMVKWTYGKMDWILTALKFSGNIW